MELFTNQVLAGISTGAIYACMALAVVMIFQAIDHLNFAQGEMAMFSTFMSWQLMQWFKTGFGWGRLRQWLRRPDRAHLRAGTRSGPAAIPRAAGA